MTASITKFAINDVTGIKNYYESYGYVVVKTLLDSAKIEQFISQYEKIKRNLRVYGWNIKQYATYFFNKLRNQEITLDMRRKSYEDYSE